LALRGAAVPLIVAFRDLGPRFGVVPTAAVLALRSLEETYHFVE
jgi:hypothetical protein